VFIDGANRPYWIAMRYGKPMIAYWHEAQKSWVNLSEVSQAEIWQMDKLALSDEMAQLYHDHHNEFINQSAYAINQSKEE